VLTARPPIAPLFPYTTLFRSEVAVDVGDDGDHGGSMSRGSGSIAFHSQRSSSSPTYTPKCRWVGVPAAFPSFPTYPSSWPTSTYCPSLSSSFTASRWV